MRIVFWGKPHRGKTVLFRELKKLFPREQTMPISGAPDGGDLGDWAQNLYRTNPDAVAQYRVKGTFSPEFVDWAANAVRNCTSRFGIVDIGGRITPENRQICREADAAIILAADDSEVAEWAAFAEELGLRVLAVIYSTLDPVEEWCRVDGKRFVGLCNNLDRERFISSSTIEGLAAWMLDEIPPEKKGIEMNTISVPQIAGLVGKAEEDYEIRGPQGSRTVHGLNWKPAEMPAVEAALKPFSMIGTPWLVDGVMPQWMAVCVMHALHPCVVALADTKVAGGSVQVCQRKLPSGSGAGELEWRVEELDDRVVVNYSSTDPITAEKLEELVPPETAAGKPVFLSGRTATWAVVDIAMAYAHVTPAVYVNQPGVGFVCAISHGPDHAVGTVA